MRSLLRISPIGIAFAWLLWHCVQAKWSEVIAPNLGWLLLGTAVATGVVWRVTRKRIAKAVIIRKEEVSVVSQERLVAREVYAWKTITRERSIYAEPK